jgi:hypothetical protein
VDPLSKSKTIFLYVDSCIFADIHHRITVSVGTGVVAALHGKEGSDGDFYVQSILEAGLPPQRPLHSGYSLSINLN